MGVGGQHHAPAALRPGSESRCPVDREAGKIPESLWTCVERLESQTFRPIATRYTDYVIPATILFMNSIIILTTTETSLDISLYFPEILFTSCQATLRHK